MLRRITLLKIFIESGENQYKEMAEIVGSIDVACEENRDTVIVADMSLNRLRFCDKDYPYKGLRDQLLNCLARNNLNAADLGPTYHSLTHEMSSEIDHIMFTANMERNIRCSVHPSTATDHHPVIAEINVLKKKDFETSKFRTIRSMKNFKQNSIKF